MGQVKQELEACPRYPPRTPPDLQDRLSIQSGLAAQGKKAVPVRLVRSGWGTMTADHPTLFREALLPVLTYRTAAVLAAAALTVGLVGCDQLDAQDDPKPANSAPSSRTFDTTPLLDMIEALAVAEEQRDGYDRARFKHWVDEDRDGCDARREVLLAEAVVAPEQGDRCSLKGGEWLSYYDEETVTDADKLDIDHMVPLAEAWDSGAHAWEDEKREKFANDLESERSLVAVTAATNRAKGDKDPTNWMPPAKSAHCTYLADWVATKFRWDLAIDQAEKTTLVEAASECKSEPVEVDPV